MKSPLKKPPKNSESNSAPVKQFFKYSKGKVELGKKNPDSVSQECAKKIK